MWKQAQNKQINVKNIETLSEHCIDCIVKFEMFFVI
jgi:hypothetical protein